MGQSYDAQQGKEYRHEYRGNCPGIIGSSTRSFLWGGGIVFVFLGFEWEVLEWNDRRGQFELLVCPSSHGGELLLFPWVHTSLRTCWQGRP